jgi:hypothetical protein
MPKPHTPKQNLKIFFGLLREIRGAARCLQEHAEISIAEAADLDHAGRKALMSRVTDQAMLNRIAVTIDQKLVAIGRVLKDDIGLYDWNSDVVEMIRLDWSEIMDVWPKTSLTPDEQLRGLKRAYTYLDQIIFQCASITLAARVNDILANLRVGQPLDWDFRFDYELPRDRELRKKLLQELAQEGGVFKCGVVDVDQMVIYRINPSRMWQVISASIPGGFILVSGLIVPWLLSRGATVIDQWPLGQPDRRRLSATFVLLFLGAGAHVVIDALKASRAKVRPNFQVMNDWILWLHVHAASVLWSLGWVLLGYILLSVIMPNLTGVSAFFAGYSIDSITTLFLSRFDVSVKAKTQELTADQSNP